MPLSEITAKDKLVTPQLELLDIHKYFGVTHALQGVTIKILPGEVIGLVGPNGAGKTTLMNIITGVFPPTSGSIKINGKEIPLKDYNTLTARRYGVSCAYQELSLCSNLSVYENFAVSNLAHNIKSFFKRDKWKEKGKNMARAMLDSVFPDHKIDVNSIVEDLTLAQRQMLEVTRAMSFDNLRLLILDEPTSSLSADRIDQLHVAIRKIAQQGISVFYISHKIDEIKKIADRIIVLTNGLNTWEGPAEATSTEELVKNLGGTVIKEELEKSEKAGDAGSIVEVMNLTTEHLDQVSLNLKTGEIVGLAGLAGSGQKQLLHEIFRAGTGHKNPGIKIQKSVSYISGDRQTEGTFKMSNIADNILISSLDQLTRWGLISRKRFEQMANYWYDKLNFKAEGIKTPITEISGGSQQKALVARGLASKCDILLLDDLTRGVDIETKQGIYSLIREARRDGKTVLWHSTEDLEMEECNRVYVMSNGAIVKELTGDAVTIENIVGACFKEKEQDICREAGVEAKKSKSPGSTRIQEMLSKRSTLPVLLFIVMLLLNGLLNANSVSYTGIDYLFGAAMPLVFAAISQMFIVMAGDIDLGLGLAVGLINVVSATFMVKNTGMGFLLCLAFIVCYILMGALIHVRKIPAIIATLGASFIWLGIALIFQATPGGNCPAWLQSFYEFKFPLVPFPVFFCIVAAIIPLWLIRYSRYGVILRGAGNNPKAIVSAGWSHFTAHITFYALSAVFIVLAGLSTTAISYGSDANASSALTLSAIATIIIGGCEFSGGIGEPVGVVAGALALSLISSLLAFMSVDSRYQTAVVGCVLIAALAAKLFLRKKVS